MQFVEESSILADFLWIDVDYSHEVDVRAFRENGAKAGLADRANSELDNLEGASHALFRFRFVLA